VTTAIHAQSILVTLLLDATTPPLPTVVLVPLVSALPPILATHSYANTTMFSTTILAFLLPMYAMTTTNVPLILVLLKED
jgi:hypothetical protein